MNDVMKAHRARHHLYNCNYGATFVPPRVRVRATVKLSAAFFHDESSIIVGGVRKCNSAVIT